MLSGTKSREPVTHDLMPGESLAVRIGDTKATVYVSGTGTIQLTKADGVIVMDSRVVTVANCEDVILATSNVKRLVANRVEKCVDNLFEDTNEGNVFIEGADAHERALGNSVLRRVAWWLRRTGGKRAWRHRQRSRFA